jgi:hypothetical protein
MSEQIPEAPAATAPQTPAPEPQAAPAAPPAPPEAPKPQPPAQQEQQPPASKNIWDDPEAAKAEIEKLRRENASERVNAKAKAAEEAKTEFAQQIGKLLGLIKDDEPADPAKLTEQLTATQAQTRDVQLELNIYKAAAAVKGANAAALLDSRSFMEQAKQADPGALDALIGQYLTQNPHLKAAPAAAPAGGADLGPGGQTAPRTYTKEQLADHDFYMKNRDDIWQAQREGRIR